MYHNGSWQALAPLALIKEARVAPPFVFSAEISRAPTRYFCPREEASIARSGTVAPLSGTCLNETTYL